MLIYLPDVEGVFNQRPFKILLLSITPSQRVTFTFDHENMIILFQKRQASQLSRMENSGKEHFIFSFF